MATQFYIKNGSLCFIVPFFTDGSSVCDTLSNVLGKYINSKDYEIDKQKVEEQKKNEQEAKKDFIGSIIGSFPQAQTNYCPNSCSRIEHNINYKERIGRFLCDCSSNAIKFHDDDIQRKNFTQFYLDNFDITYKSDNAPNFECSFEMTALLYLMNEDKQRIAYLLFEIDMRTIRYGVNAVSSKSDKSFIKPDSIIFIKHLFYKNKLVVQIRNEQRNVKQSLQEWVVDYIKTLCKVLYINDQENVPGYIKDHAFKYSFIELKGIYTPGGEQIKLGNIDDFLNRYSQQIYGLLLSDEGWSNVPIEILKSKLQDYWTTRDYNCTFFLQHNALTFNLKKSNSGEKQTKFVQKWFAKYNDNKYTNYVSAHPCLTGIDTLTIFPFLNAIYKEINLDKYENIIRSEGGNIQDNSYSSKIKKTRGDLDSLQEILNKTSVNLEEMASMESCIYKQFGIIEQLARVKDLYKQLVEELNFEYNHVNNQRINILTFATVVIGILSPFLPAIYNDYFRGVGRFKLLSMIILCVLFAFVCKIRMDKRL